MSRSLTRILVVLLTALPLATRARADSAAGSILDDYGLFALDELRTRGFGSMANVGVNEGTLHSQGALNAKDFTVSASTVRLGDGSLCAHLFANLVTRSAPGCGPAAEHGLDGPLLGTVDPSDACGIPKPFPACGGPGVGVSHGSTLTLAPGKYGDALVEGGGAGAGTLILTGGKYEFCNLHVSRYARLLVRGPSEIYVSGEASFSNQTTVGPAAGAPIGPRDVKLFVNGGRVRFSRKANVTGKVCAPHGALFMTEGAKFVGCALAKRIRTDHVTVKGGCQTARPPTTTTTVPPTTTTVPPTTTTTSTTSTVTTTSSSTSTSSTSTTTTVQVTTSTSSSTSSTAPQETTSTSSTSSTVTSLPSTTSSSTLPTTTSTVVSTTTTTTSSSSSTSTSNSSSTTTVSSSTTTSNTVIEATTTTTSTLPLPPTQLDLTIIPGTANCGGTSLNPGPAAPFAGQILDAASAKISDLGLGCLYFGSGQNTAIAGGVIPTGSTTFFKIASTNGTALTLAGATGPSASCTKGAGPAKHCVKGEPGTDTHGLCNTDADCQAHRGSCVLDANCFFGPPLSIPNGGTSTCVVNVVQTDVTGTADSGTGAVSVNLPLASRVYLTATTFDDNSTTVVEACPRCINAKCNGGANLNGACTTTAPGLTSVDCPPRKDQFLATLPIGLNPFTTGATQLNASGAGLFCTAVAPNTGAFGKKLARILKENGSSAGDLGDRAAHAGSFASTFCIPPTGNLLVDPAGGLPGPGGFSIAGTLRLE